MRHEFELDEQVVVNAGVGEYSGRSGVVIGKARADIIMPYRVSFLDGSTTCFEGGELRPKDENA